MARRDDEELEREFQPHPGDAEFVTRGEYRRMSALLVRRLDRIERLCFEDGRDATTGVFQPSLQTFIQTGSEHIQVMCSWARLIKWALLAVVSIGSALAGAYQAFQILAPFLS